MIKDLWRCSLVFGFVIAGWYYGVLRYVVKKRKIPLAILGGLIVVALAISALEHVPVMTMVVGMKYDLYPLFVMRTGLIVAGIVRELPYIKHSSLDDTFKRLGNLVIFVVVGGLVWQVVKVIRPDIFSAIGYGPVGDYILGERPPLYYRTGPGGIMRLAGLFAGPNNYGYFLVLFFSWFTWRMHRHYTNPYIRFLVIVLYSISLIRTLSRGAWIGVAVQLGIVAWRVYPTWRRRCIGGGLVGLIGIGIISVYKAGSSIGHLQARQEGMQAFLAQPRGYGLGSAGPSVHYQGVYLPENQYLQILLDLGLGGFMLRLVFFISIGVGIQQKLGNPFKGAAKNQPSFGVALLLLGSIGLAVEGLFLHVLEDSMVNYLYFLSVGIMFFQLSKE